MGWWTAAVGAVEGWITSVGAATGGLLAGVLLVTLSLRIALIPVMLPLAVRARERQRIVDSFRPELRALKAEHRKDPDRLHREIVALHARHGLRFVDLPGLFGALIQLPLLIALFQAVLHVSEGTPLASGGLLLGLGASVVSVLSVVLAGQGGSKPVLALSALLPVAIAAWLGRGIGGYLLAFYAGATIQGLLMRWRSPAAPAHATSA